MGTCSGVDQVLGFLADSNLLFSDFGELHPYLETLNNQCINEMQRYTPARASATISIVQLLYTKNGRHYDGHFNLLRLQ